MNKVILIGRLTRNPDIRYTQGNEPLTLARYTLAVNRRFKRQGDADTDFINCVALGKNGEFAEKYLSKGQMISVVGRIQVRSWEDKDGAKKWSTDVVVEEHYFVGGKTGNSQGKETESIGDFYTVNGNVEDDDLPF